MDIQELARQYGQDPQALDRLIHSNEGRQLLRLLQQKKAAVPGADRQINTQTAAQLLQSLASDAEGRRLLQRLAEQLQR